MVILLLLLSFQHRNVEFYRDSNHFCYILLLKEYLAMHWDFIISLFYNYSKWILLVLIGLRKQIIVSFSSMYFYIFLHSFLNMC